MADNVQIGAGTGPVIATETISAGVQIPVEKLDVGFHGMQERVIERGVAGTVPVQNVRDWVTVSVTPSLTLNTQYNYGVIMGGPQVVSVFEPGCHWGTIEQLIIADVGGTASRLNIMLFTAPLTGTYADMTTYTGLNATDLANFQGYLGFSDYQQILSEWYVDDWAQSLSLPITSVDQNLYLLLISAGYETYTTGATPSNNPLVLKMTIRQD